MNCKECVALLESYHDCELGPEAAQYVESHLKDCTECMTALDQLESEVGIYRQYASQVEVPVHLWEAVRAQLDAPTASDRSAGVSLVYFLHQFFVPRVSVPMAIVVALVAVLATVIVMRRLAVPSTTPIASMDTSQPLPTAENRPAPAEVSNPAAPEKETRKAFTIARAPAAGLKIMAPERLVREAQKKYISAINALSRDVERKQPQMDSETRLKLEEALASIDKTIEATRRAVRQHPNDAVAVQYMFAAYAKKVDVLREIAAGRSL